MSGETKYRIGAAATIVLVGLAVIADLIGLIPIAKDFTATIFWIAAGAYLYTKGIKLWNGKRLAATAISWVASLIPVIQELPLEVTAGIIAVIVITRIEDRTGLSILKPMASGQSSLPLNQGGVRAPSGPAPAPLNVDGVRQPSRTDESDASQAQEESARRTRLDDMSPRPLYDNDGEGDRQSSTQTSAQAPASATTTTQASTNSTASYTGPNAPSTGSTTTTNTSSNSVGSTSSGGASSGGASASGGGASSGGGGAASGGGAGGGGGGGGGGGK